MSPDIVLYNQKATENRPRPGGNEGRKERKMTIKLDEYSKISTDEYTLNYISLLAGEAAERFEEKGVYALAKEARELHNLIYNKLFEAGLYDGMN